MEEKDCIFCKIIRGELPSQKVYEDDWVLAILDIHPANPGHTLIIPKHHQANMWEASDEMVGHMARVARRLSHAVVAATGAQGWNLAVNNGAAAGQIIFHAHWHVIPRFVDDGLKPWRDLAYGPGELEAMGDTVRAAYEQFEKKNPSV